MAIKYYDEAGQETTDLSKATRKVTDNPGSEGDVSTNLPPIGSTFLVGGSPFARTKDGRIVSVEVGGRNDEANLGTLKGQGFYGDNTPSYSTDVFGVSGADGSIGGRENPLTPDQVYAELRSFQPTTSTQSLTSGSSAVGATNIGSTAEALNPNSDQAALATQAGLTPSPLAGGTVQAASTNQQTQAQAGGSLDAQGVLTLPNGQRISPQDPNYQTFLAQAGLASPTAPAAQPTSLTSAPTTPISTPQGAAQKIASPEELQALAAQGLTEADLVRSGNDIYLRAGSKFAGAQSNPGVNPDGQPAVALGEKVPSPAALEGYTENDIIRQPNGDIYLKPGVPVKWGSGASGEATMEGEVISPYDGLLKKYGVTPPDSNDNPVTSFADTYKQLLTDLGIPSIKEAFDRVNQEYADLQNKLNDEIVEINDNPWLTEGVRVRQVRSAEARYEGKLAILTNQMKLYNSLYEQGLSEARFVAGAAIDQAQFDTNTQLKLLQLAQDEEQALAELAELDTQVVEVGGHKLLINTQTGETIQDLGISKIASSGGGSSSGSGFTSQEKRKLEQANLLEASREEQLDFLYGSENTNSAQFYIDRINEEDPAYVDDEGNIKWSSVPQAIRSEVFNATVSNEVEEPSFTDKAIQVGDNLLYGGANAIKSGASWFLNLF